MARQRQLTPFARQIPLSYALSLLLLTNTLTGCASYAPYVGPGPHPQFERGQPVPPIDFLANVLAIPMKLILLEWRFGNHAISPETEGVLVRYVNDRQSDVSSTVVRLNQYAPHKDFKRLLSNQRVAWPYRLVFGSLTLLIETFLPGRIFGGSLLSDYYNPWTNTIHIYSDHPAIGLHELGHAYDFSQQPYRGTYGFSRQFFILALHQEWQATDEAISYLIEIGDRRNELRAYKTLYPAYGSYLGTFLLPIPLGGIPGIFIGHVVGRTKAAARVRFYRQVDAQMRPQSLPSVTPATVP